MNVRILFVTPFYPPDIGGIACHVSNLAKRLSKRHDVNVVACGSKYSFRKEKDLKIFELPSLSPPPYPYQTLSNFRIPFPVYLLTRILESMKFDILHVHGHHYPVTWIALKKCKRKPSVLTIHGMYSLAPRDSPGKTFEEIFNKTIFRSVLRNTSAVIGLTPIIAEYAKKYAEHSKPCYSIPNGVDVELYLNGLRKKSVYRSKLGLPQDKNVIVFSGRFALVKGILEMVEASRHILREREDVFFLFVGNGPLEGYVRESFKGLQNMKIIEWMPSDVIHEVYIASDILVMPSKWEALPITLLEAMAAQLHIIATPVGGVPEVLVGYPYKTYIRGFSSESIADAIKETLNKASVEDTKIEKQKAIAYVKKFDWAYVTSRVESVYTALTKT